ncbi:hypothetical protein [Marinomonas shanghaiensis]|uniref:hypothetical protein n=1 Tax=Marinomonas shanghaiensis TaxID=2202418 RepID=UPI0013002928|nr:hypothetical protein [Marinomonas shanghaiensis]
MSRPQGLTASTLYFTHNLTRSTSKPCTSLCNGNKHTASVKQSWYLASYLWCNKATIRPLQVHNQEQKAA